jgi:hypothetical protein
MDLRRAQPAQAGDAHRALPSRPAYELSKERFRDLIGGRTTEAVEARRGQRAAGRVAAAAIRRRAEPAATGTAEAERARQDDRQATEP